MRTIQLSWKQSLSTLALLTAFNGPIATLAVAEPDKPVNASAAALDVSRPPVPPEGGVGGGSRRDADAPRRGEQARNSSADSADANAGQKSSAPGVTPPAPTAAVDPATGLPVPIAGVPVASPGQIESGRPGGHLEAKLREIVLAEVRFENLPLGEVLHFLSDESLKLDPEKTGLNFLINPNFPPAPMTAIDPATGLPVPVATGAFDISTVTINFNLPLRHVSMKGVLDAIVKVANHPIEYSVEDYAIVFSPKLETISGQPMFGAGAAPPSAPFRPGSAFDGGGRPLAVEQESGTGARIEAPTSLHRPADSPVVLKPLPFNVDFGPARGEDSSKQVGPPAAGRTGDYWNTVAVPWSNAHTESGLKAASGEPSPIEVEMINLGGCWGNSGGMGVKDPMLDGFNYPVNNQGGNSTVILHHVPPGKYQVYLYGHGTDPVYYGDYTLTVGSRSYGRKSTSHGSDAVQNTKWVEGSQYVKFSGVKVAAGENVEILIRPGGQVTDHWGRTFADAMICGLQLIPVK